MALWIIYEYNKERLPLGTAFQIKPAHAGFYYLETIGEAHIVNTTYLRITKCTPVIIVQDVGAAKFEHGFCTR